MFVPSRTYRITYDDSWFDSAEKQKLCAHENNFSNSQKLDFALIRFAVDEYTNFPGLPNFSEFLDLQKYSKYPYFYKLFCFSQILSCFAFPSFCKPWACFFFAKTFWQSWETVELQEYPYFQQGIIILFKGTNLANQIMMSYVWREFSSVRGKMIKRFRSVKRSSLGMPPCIPFSINIISSSFVPLYFYHFMCYVLCLECLALSFFF